MQGEFSKQKRLDDEESSETIESPSERILYVDDDESSPVDTVLGRLDALDADETLDVVSSMAIVPLYDKLDDLGWQYEATRTGADRWRIRIMAEASDDLSGERPRRPRRNRLK